MATGAQVVEKVAKATHLQPSAISRFCRDMREADPTFWPEAARGGGKGAAHVEPFHLVNLTLSLAVAGPIAGIPKAGGNYREVVRGYRALIPHRPKDHLPDLERYGRAASYLRNANVFSVNQSLGDALDQLVELLTDAEAAKTLETAGLCIELHTERMPRALVRYRTFDPPKDHTAPKTELIYRPRDTPIGLSKSRDPNWNFLPPRLISRTALIPASLFTVMASLWSDTKQRQTTLVLPDSASATAEPEYESAATLPQAAASRLNQSSTERRRPSRQASRTLQRSVAAIKEE